MEQPINNLNPSNIPPVTTPIQNSKPVIKGGVSPLLIVFFIVLFSCSAFFLGQYLEKNKNSADNISNQIRTIPTAIPTTNLYTEQEQSTIANWKTVTFEDFSFKYPPDWIYYGKSEGCGPAIFPPETKDYWVTICPYGTQTTPGKEAQRIADVNQKNIIKTQEPIEVAGIQGVKQTLFNGTDKYSQEIYLVNNRGLHVIYAYTNKLQFNLMAKYQLVFDKIVASFKFITPKDLTKNIVCRDDNLNISFLIPETWQCQSDSITGIKITYGDININVSDMGRGGPCEFDQTCSKTVFYKTSMVDLYLYRGQDSSEIFGTLKGSMTEQGLTHISITYPNMDKEDVSEETGRTIINIINSLIVINN